MKSISKLIVVSLFTLLGTAHGAQTTLRCQSAQKALNAVRSVTIQQQTGDLFGRVGTGVAAVQVVVNGTLRLHRIPVSSYYSKGFFINIFPSGNAARTAFYLHGNDRSPDLITGEIGYGSLHFPVNCRFLN